MAKLDSTTVYGELIVTQDIMGPNVTSGVDPGHTHTAYQAAGTYNTIIGTDTDINTSGAVIIDNIYVTDGVITSMGTRTLTAADIGAGYSTIIDDSTPTPTNGRFWYNPSAGNLLLGVGGSWVSAVHNGSDGSDGDGWTSGSYSSFTGTVSFASSDGLGFTTGDLRASLIDGSITYSKVANALKQRSTDNDGAWDFSANGIVDAAFSANTTVTFTNLQKNKSFKVKLVTTNSPVITLPTYVTTLKGSADPSTNGTYFLYFDCWDDGVVKEVLLSITSEA